MWGTVSRCKEQNEHLTSISLSISVSKNVYFPALGVVYSAYRSLSSLPEELEEHIAVVCLCVMNCPEPVLKTLYTGRTSISGPKKSPEPPFTVM